MKKGLQLTDSENIHSGKFASTEQIIDFLENYRLLLSHASVQKKSKLISLKVKPDLLTAFKQRCEIEGVAYQTQIKRLMRNWLDS